MKESYTQRNIKDNRNLQKRLNKLSKESEKLLVSDGFHTKKNSQISLHFRNYFDKNFSQNKIKQNKKYSGITNNINNPKTFRNNFPSKSNNDKNIQLAQNYISPTIIDSNSVLKNNQKYLQEERNSNQNSYANRGNGIKQNHLKNSLSNGNQSIKYDGSNYSINFINTKNLNVNFNNKYIKNSCASKNLNLNYLNINSANENESFHQKSTSGNIPFTNKNNNDLNFTSRITDGNSILKENLNGYEVNLKVI